MNEELAVREALQDMTLGQPAAPVDRMTGVRRRHVRRRTAQLVVAAAVVALVAAGSVFIRSPFSSDTEPANHGGASWMLPWPTRYGATDPTAAATTRAAAVSYYNRFHGSAIHAVRTLYVGTPAGTNVQWVVVEARHQLIALESPDDGLSWTPYISPAPPADSPVIGFAGVSAGATDVLAIGAPHVDAAAVDHLYAGLGPPFGGWKQLHDGIVAVRFHQATLPGEVFVADTEWRHVLAAVFPEGTPKEGDLRPWQKALDTSSTGTRLLSFEAGEGGGDTMTIRVPRNGTITVSINCMGPAPVRLTILGAEEQATATQPTCTGSGAPVTGQETLLVHRGDRLQLTTEASQLTRFAVGVYLV